MLKKQDRIEGIIQYLDESGTGVLFHEKDKVLVRHVLAKEKVQVQIEKRIKEGYVGKVENVLTPSPFRVKPACPVYERCGSCHLLHVKYEKQLAIKKQMIVDMVKKSKVSSIQVQDCVGMEHPYAYRNKIIFSFGKRKKEWIAGFYEEYTHRIIPIKECLLHEPYVNTLLQDLQAIVKKCRMEPFDEDTGRGYLRHILVRRGVISDETMLVLVVSDSMFKAKKQFLKSLRESHPEIKTVVLNVNKRRTSVVLGEEEHILFGKGYIEDTLCGKRFAISSRSFYQINHEQCEKLYDKALSLLSLTGKETLIDAYCGIGTIGLVASDKVRKVYGVEVNKEAVRDAIGNAKRNGIKNAFFTCADAGRFMEEKARKKETIDVLVMDPAREGSDIRFLSSALRMKPKKIVYISCDPKTQIRDLEYLKQHGYQTDKMYLYDLFPNTFHVESVCLLERKDRNERRK